MCHSISPVLLHPFLNLHMLLPFVLSPAFFSSVFNLTTAITIAPANSTPDTARATIGTIKSRIIQATRKKKPLMIPKTIAVSPVSQRIS